MPTWVLIGSSVNVRIDEVTDNIVSSDPIISGVWMNYSLFTFLDSDTDSDADLDYKPNSFIVLWRIFHTAELYSDSNPNCQLQEWYRNQDQNGNPYLWMQKKPL